MNGDRQIDRHCLHLKPQSEDLKQTTGN